MSAIMKDGEVELSEEPAPGVQLSSGQVVLVKIGGAHLESEEAIAKMAAGVKSLLASGAHVAIVHGAGKGIDAAMKDAGLGIKKVAGLRVTSPEALSVIEYVLRRTNRRLVRALRKLGVGAVGLDASDVTRVMMHPPVQANGAKESLGLVGEVVGFNFDGCDDMRGDMIDGVVPVIYCVGEAGGTRVNINADSIAGVLAGGLHAHAALFISDVPGILDASGTPLPSVDPRDIKELEESGVIKNGMLPKVEACIEAVDRGVPQVIISAGVQEAVAGTGTMLIKAGGRKRISSGIAPAPTVKIVE